MVKDVATYFSMTLGAFVFLQSMDEVHIRIALYQDEKVECCEVLSSLTLTDEDLDKLGFEKVAEEFIEECKSEVLLLGHKKTGAQVASMSNDDKNNVFGIIFRTPFEIHE